MTKKPVAGKDFELTGDDVKTTKTGGRLYVVCPLCRKRYYLGSWVAAHLAECDLRAVHVCGATITILRET
jgi:hypothetical protein